MESCHLELLASLRRFLHKSIRPAQEVRSEVRKAIPLFTCYPSVYLLTRDVLLVLI